jgi:hypothetical protein
MSQPATVRRILCRHLSCAWSADGVGFPGPGRSKSCSTSSSGTTKMAATSTASPKSPKGPVSACVNLSESVWICLDPFGLVLNRRCALSPSVSCKICSLPSLLPLLLLLWSLLLLLFQVVLIFLLSLSLPYDIFSVLLLLLLLPILFSRPKLLV